MADPKAFLDVLKGRKSIRSFQARPVDSEVIKKILELATYAPTNCNQQAWNFIVVTDNETKERLVKEAASNTNLRRAPAIIVVTYDGWNYKEAIQGGALAVGHILLAAENFGLGALPMNSYGADTQIKKVLQVPASETICCFVLLGYPDGRAQAMQPVSRRPVEEVVHWGVFGTRKRPPFTYGPDDWTLETLRMHQRYYCRKTTLGKEMDIMSRDERALVRNTLAAVKTSILDLCSYDGSYVSEFPNVPVQMVDLLSVTMIYKLERLPAPLRSEMFSKAYATLEQGGEFIIFSRKSNPFLNLFFFIVKILFGNDVRKTGMYAFFGPYQPIRVSHTLTLLRRAGFTSIDWTGYFPVPPFYEQVYQMFLQYRKSEGSSYLHRETRLTVVSRLLSALFSFQGFMRVGRAGSVVVIRCQK
ncbi:MAG: Nitroreductase [Parcubacteria group bacterium GW2011_GWA2_47_10]|nr:MAG: Nitroreductase [Parcubacteria group bacterium GW2011_GWA2_47_10]